MKATKDKPLHSMDHNILAAKFTFATGKTLKITIASGYEHRYLL